MVQAQPWIVNNKPFVNIVEEKLKYFVHDEENFIITNFDFVYQRLKGLIENYHIYPAKLERVFSRPVYERKGHPRMRRKNPDTLKMRIKLKKYRYKQGKGKKGKRPYGIRKLPQLAHQAIKYQVETIDQAFYMKQVFRKKPSQHHRA